MRVLSEAACRFGCYKATSGTLHPTSWPVHACVVKLLPFAVFCAFGCKIAIHAMQGGTAGYQPAR
jgi:hypothetical protein